MIEILRAVCDAPGCQILLRSHNIVGFCRDHRNLSPKLRQWRADHRARLGGTDKDYYRNRDLVRKYGITLVEWRALLDSIDHRCQICQERFEEAGLVPDHCHSTGKMRGVLCRKHNSAIGFLGDTEADVMRAVEYLRGADVRPS